MYKSTLSSLIREIMRKNNDFNLSLIRCNTHAHTHWHAHRHTHIHESCSDFFRLSILSIFLSMTRTSSKVCVLLFRSSSLLSQMSLHNSPHTNMQTNSKWSPFLMHNCWQGESIRGTSRHIRSKFFPQDLRILFSHVRSPERNVFMLLAQVKSSPGCQSSLQLSF